MTRTKRDPRQDARRVRRGFISGDTLTLCAIGIVVALVSFPRLRDFVLRANEVDARTTLLLLGDAVFAAERGDDLGQVLAETSGLSHRLQDAKPLAGGRLVAYHGYCFKAGRDAAGERVLYAWPHTGGRTGVGAYMYSQARGLFGHPNEGNRFSGLDRPLSALRAGDMGWQRVR